MGTKVPLCQLGLYFRILNLYFVYMSNRITIVETEYFITVTILYQSDVDLVVFNPTYSKSIGVPTISFSVTSSHLNGDGTVSEGGAVDLLTVPYRYFSYMVSGIGSGDVLDYFFKQSQNKPKRMIESGAETKMEAKSGTEMKAEAKTEAEAKPGTEMKAEAKMRTEMGMEMETGTEMETDLPRPKVEKEEEVEENMYQISMEVPVSN